MTPDETTEPVTPASPEQGLEPVMGAPPVMDSASFDGGVPVETSAHRSIETTPPTNASPISAATVGVVALVVGLLGGYLLFGLPKQTTSAPVASTSTATYAPDVISAPPAVIGKMAVRNLKTLDEWDPLDAFDGGFPLPPEDWTQPLLALNPPIPVAATVATIDGGTPMGGPSSGGSPFANSPMRPPTLDGNINLPPMQLPTGGTEVVPLNPGPPEGATTQEPAPMTSGSILIGVTLNGVNTNAAQSTITALAAKYTGASRSFSHMGPEGDLEAEGVLLLVAPSDAEKALSDIRKLGAVSGEDRSEGTIRSRQSRLSSIFSSRLATLRKRREDLMFQFLEDADPVKNIDAAIDREARALSAVKLSGAADRLAAIRVLLKP